MTKAIRKISDLKPDSHNANKGTERGQYMIEASLRKVGAGRSIVVDRDGRIIAGNKTVENWASIANDDDVQVIQTDGKKLVVVQRTDLDLDDADNTTARELAYYDNRSSQVSLDWDAEVLLADLAAAVPLNDFFYAGELNEIIASANGDDLSIDYSDHWQGMPDFDNDGKPIYKSIKVNFQTEKDYIAFAELINQNLTEKTKWIYYPKLEHIEGSRYQVINES